MKQWKPSMACIIIVVSLLLFAITMGSAQREEGLWTIGLHGGGNIWFNDYNQRIIGDGGEVMLRYGITPSFSAGVVVGYEELKSEQIPSFPKLNSYIKAHAIPGSLNGWYQFSPGESFNPYVTFGVGALLFKRVDGNNKPIPDGRFHNSIFIPLGLGCDIVASRDVSFVLEAGFRVTDDYVDNIRSGKLDSYATGKLGFNFRLGSSDGDDDDNDGLTNGEEKSWGTNPNKPDSDGDSLSDGEEVHTYHTNPLQPDSDGDGLSDGDEVRQYKTMPGKTDSDADGLSDGDEVLKYKTDPLKPDTDGDGLTDGDEVHKYTSDPMKSDTDGDGLTDSEEVKTTKTDPAKMDTDGDGLNDFDEARKYHTDPNVVDTDLGGVNDGAEVQRGSNPLDPKDDVVKDTVKTSIVLEKGKTVILRGVNFESGKATLTPNSQATLEDAYRALVANPDVNVQIVGHTDNRGKRAMNQDLSVRRALAVKDWLVFKGIDATRLTTMGRGMDEPIDVNTTADGRASNRRIEFRVQK